MVHALAHVDSTYVDNDHGAEPWTDEASAQAGAACAVSAFASSSSADTATNRASATRPDREARSARAADRIDDVSGRRSLIQCPPLSAHRHGLGLFRHVHRKGGRYAPGRNPYAPHMTYVDAVVVGSGPNGHAAAIAIERTGRKVIVFGAADTVEGGCQSS